MKDFLRRNGALILIAAGLLAAIAVVISLTLGGRANPFANLWGVITTPVRNGVAAVGDWVEGKYSDAFETDLLRDEVERLHKELSDMSEKAREGEAASRENENFRELLNLQKKRRDFVFESAMITAWGTSNWESSFTISKGSSREVAVDDCVVDAYGNLCGIVTEVGLNWATVSTLIDTGTDMGGAIGRTGSAAILEGDFALMGKGCLKLSYLPENVEL
ncbi:MAG: rod shape-determining protein MreC, partial [Oscillospiraceae bacterium]